MNDFNFISIGDHCAIPLILRDLNLKKKSYPFDWISASNIEKTNIIRNCELVRTLLETKNAKIVTQLMCGDAFTNGNREYEYDGMLFPHEYPKNKNDTTEILVKYERRFERLLDHLLTKTNKFFLLTRFVYISQEQFDNIIRILISCNKNNRIIFISGVKHNYLFRKKYKKYVTFKYIFYDFSNLANLSLYDVPFRRDVRNYLENKLKK